MKLELDCKEMSRLISEGLDTSLPPAERTRMSLHFVICETCRNVDEQFGFLRRAMRRLARDRETDEPADT
ncbi:MAG: zf-HC2 domain-containing protein [Rhodoferax sp.]|nr:zf-HC2 domain-containing protein [Rhodoferax sp.]